MVSIPACHAGDPGSIPGNGANFVLYFFVRLIKKMENKTAPIDLPSDCVSCEVVVVGQLGIIVNFVEISKPKKARLLNSSHISNTTPPPLSPNVSRLHNFVFLPLPRRRRVHCHCRSVFVF